MNYRLYKVVGKHEETKRNRTITIPAKSTEMAEQIAKEKGLLLPLKIEEHPFEPPSERQLAYAKDLGIDVPLDATKEDVSCLLSRTIDKDNVPSPGLIEFADGRNMFFSQYIGKRRLYNLVFNSLNGVDKIAFFTFSIYRWLSEDRHANLDTHPKKEIFYEFAESVKNDASFEKSMLNYGGEDLRFFGTITVNDYAYNAGSNRTIAYKKAAEFLRDRFNLPLTKNFAIKDEQKNHNSLYEDKESDIMRKQEKITTSAGCLTYLLFVVILGILCF